MPVGPSYRAGRISGLASQSSSSLAAFTGAGRVCGTSARNAPSVTSRGHVHVGADLQDCPRVGAPPQVRLDAHEHDRVAVVDPSREEPARGPIDPTRGTFDQTNVRAVDLEVVELLGVDLREATGSPLRSQGPDGRGRGLPAVVPAAERTHHHGTRKLRADPVLHVGHPHSLSSRGVPVIPPQDPITSPRPGAASSGVLVRDDGRWHDALLARRGNHDHSPLHVRPTTAQARVHRARPALDAPRPIRARRDPRGHAFRVGLDRELRRGGHGLGFDRRRPRVHRAAGT
jgi:hypothetical protein